MPTPARGPQTMRRAGCRKNDAPLRRGAMLIRTAAPCRAQRSNRLHYRLQHRTAPALVFLPPTTPRHALAHVLYDWKAEPQRDAQRRNVLSDPPQPRFRGRRGRREPRFLCSRAVLLRMRTRSRDRRLGSHRIGACCSRKKSMGVRGLAWHVPCHIRCIERTIWIPHRRVFVFNLRVEQARIILLRRIRPLP
jgi:hypothetical protein